MKKFVLPLLVLSTMALGGCKLFPSKSNSGGGTSTSIDDGKIEVNFYLDFNKVATNEVYQTYRIANDSKLTKPNTPTEPPLPEFPVFKGWSTKQLIDDEKDLWNFDTDIMHLEPGYRIFRLYGFWAAQGE